MDPEKVEGSSGKCLKVLVEKAGKWWVLVAWKY
jgi:hypothetical protein